MTDDNPYDDAADDDYDSTEDVGYAADGTPVFGTASEGNPITDDAAYPEAAGEPRITIDPDNQPERTYKLTERVKKDYENAVENSLERLETEYYDMWWQGTTLHVEYEGKVRAPEGRPGPDQSASSKSQKQMQDKKQQQQQMNPLQAMAQQQRGQPSQQEMVLPREPRPPFVGRRGEPQVQMPVPEDAAPDLKFFDEGMLPVSGFTEFDIQIRANRAPLAVEDMFVVPWSDDYPVQTPIDYEPSDDTVEEEMYEVEDFRDKTDDKNEQLSKGKRGNRYHL